MANLKEIRIRIKSVNSTMQITSAMKMVSAAKLRRAQDAIVKMRPYANKLSEILTNLSGSLSSSEGVYSEQRAVEKVLIIAITSNRGLCGAFNANVIKKANSLIANEFADKDVKVMSLGKKGYDSFRKHAHLMPTSVAEEHNAIYDNLDFEHVAPIAEEVMEAFANREFDHVVMIYNQFKNAAVQLLTAEQYLPVVPPEVDENDAGLSVDYLFEPDRAEIVQQLIPKSLKTQLYKGLLDSQASEHGARMTAMHKATDNANELQRSLKLHYNKARQAAITNEILEIVGGAEALNG